MELFFCVNYLLQTVDDMLYLYKSEIFARNAPYGQILFLQKKKRKTQLFT